MKVAKFHDVDLDALQFSPMCPLRTGGHMVKVTDAQGSPVTVQTPKMYLPFGLSDYRSVDLSFRDNDQFYEWYQNLNELAKERGRQYLGHSYTPSVVDELFSSAVRQDPKGRYSATLRLGLPARVDVFDDAKNHVGETALVKGSTVVVLMELVGLWFVNKRFGIKWKPLQVLLLPAQPPPPKAQLATYAFLDDNEH